MINNRKKLLLIIEDEIIAVKIMVEKLVSEGFDVIEAYDGLQGLKMAESEHPDLILLDLLMPKMDGMTMLKELRKDDWGKKVPVIILTNLSSVDQEKLEDVSVLEPSYYLIKSNKSMQDIVDKINEKLKENVGGVSKSDHEVFDVE